MDSAPPGVPDPFHERPQRVRASGGGEVVRQAFDQSEVVAPGLDGLAVEVKGGLQVSKAALKVSGFEQGGVVAGIFFAGPGAGSGGQAGRRPRKGP